MNTEHTNQSTAPEPFGYFKAEPFGWTDCEESDEGAIALYDRPQAEPVNQQLLDALGKISRMTMSMYTSAGEAMSDAKRIAHEAIAAAEQAQHSFWAQPRCACGDGFTSDAVCANCLAAAEPVALEPVDGDLLPPIGDTVLIHLSRPDGWFPHQVVGYYVWGDLSGSKHLYRVFVRVVDAEGYANARPLDAIRRLGDEAAQQQAVAAPDGSVPVPLGFLQAFHTLAHNYSLQAQAPDHYAGTERDAFSDAYARCGSELAKLRAMLAAAPQAAVAAPLPPYNVFSDDDGDSWREHPADADFVEGLQLGDEFELLAGWWAVRVTFRVTKVPDDESDDYEVEEVTAPAAAQKGGA